MGNWNRRYMPRKKYKQYDYNDPPPSPPKPHNYGSHSSGLKDRRVPSWEIDYCHSAKVPWNKVVASKKYIYSYPRVLEWDGSAAKEALENAKQRFWANLNGLPCDNPLPDPDMYIGEIDWNPYLDPELMADLELQAFNPDEAQTVEPLETINEDIECAQRSENPWEGDNNMPSKESSKGWGTWDDGLNLKSDDPWEESCKKLVDSSTDNVWKSGNESWNCNDKTNSVKQDGWGCGWGQRQGEGNPWNCNDRTNSVKQDGWGCGWEQRQGESIPWNKNTEGSSSFGNNNYMGSRDRGWREKTNVSWGVRDGWSSRGGGRKRESSVQHASKYKSSRCVGNSYGYGHGL